MCVAGLYRWGRGASRLPNIFKSARKLVKRQPCYRELATVFSVTFSFVIIVGQLVKMPPQQKVFRHINGVQRRVVYGMMYMVGVVLKVVCNSMRGKVWRSVILRVPQKMQNKTKQNKQGWKLWYATPFNYPTNLVATAILLQGNIYRTVSLQRHAIESMLKVTNSSGMKQK